MNIRATLVLLALLPLMDSAQIPNAGFENWLDQGGYLDPVGWLTYNDVVTPGGWPAITVEQGSPGAVGAYHAVITTVSVPLGPTIQGWISAGTSGSNAGFPYTARPAMLTGQWQYGIQPNDTSQIQLALSKWNSSTQSSDGIAWGAMEVTGNLSTWQSFAVQLSYLSPDIPDTAYIQIVSSINFSAPIAGSFVKVDDLAFTGTVGMDEQLGRSNTKVYPSPATDILHITSSEPGALLLFDANGRQVQQARIITQLHSLDASTLAPGLISYQLIDRHGISIATGRWVKE
ncbi:MAG: hypothetical protein WEC15_07170 [Flavobacteriales bacterium]